jgi:L-lactate dehydrogenase complex protein LldF
VIPDSRAFLENADEALQQPEKVARRGLIGQVLPRARQQAVDDFIDFDRLREHVQRVRQHSLDHLEHYLAQFEEQARANGNSVHFAASGEELNSIVLGICQQHRARRVAKGKSMITEETGLNDHLKRAGLDVLETDLGEYIIQQAGETPSHIVAPALHKSLADIRELFLARHQLGPRELPNAQTMVSEARQVLREHFLAAEVGVIGANALIAENGYSLLVTNEGNGDLCANLPPVLIVCTSIERILPRATDVAALLRLLVRSATGQSVTSYTSFYSGPRRPDDNDGPIETHFVLLDNKRSDILASDYREMLQCIRCGACLNHCPIYVNVGGHAYGSVYQGPMGSVLTPLLTSLAQSSALPNACTSCGRCEEVCPAAIPLPALLRGLRHEENTQKLSAPRWRLGVSLHSAIARRPWLYRRLTGMGVRILNRIGRRSGVLRKLPLAGGWTEHRDFPAPQQATFIEQFKHRREYR